MADIQLQIQNIIKLADTANNQLADIETILLQTRETHRVQISRDIYSIFKKLKNIIHRDIKQQAYYIQVSLANELDQYKGKEEEAIDKHIKNYRKCIKMVIETYYNQ